MTDLLAGADLGGVREHEGGEMAVPATLRDRLREARCGPVGRQNRRPEEGDASRPGYRKTMGGRE